MRPGRVSLMLAGAHVSEDRRAGHQRLSRRIRSVALALVYLSNRTALRVLELPSLALEDASKHRT